MTFAGSVLPLDSRWFTSPVSVSSPEDDQGSLLSVVVHDPFCKWRPVDGGGQRGEDGMMMPARRAAFTHHHSFLSPRREIIPEFSPACSARSVASKS
jgi:hypothetical protein